MATIAEVRQAITSLAAFQNNPLTEAWVMEWCEALDHPRTGTMRAWFESHHGSEVETLQFSTDTLMADVPAAWAPGARTVDAQSRATSVRFGESVREYAGMRVLAAGPDTLVVTGDWNTVLYRTV